MFSLHGFFCLAYWYKYHVVEAFPITPKYTELQKKSAHELYISNEHVQCNQWTEKNGNNALIWALLLYIASFEAHLNLQPPLRYFVNCIVKIIHYMVAKSNSGLIKFSTRCWLHDLLLWYCWSRWRSRKAILRHNGTLLST